jgi:hypothetical protein
VPLWLNLFFLLLAIAVGNTATVAHASPAPAPATVERWDVFELSLPGPSNGNAFIDVSLAARFSRGDKSFDVSGFYDGDGMYRLRFMPDEAGEWRYETRSNRAELSGKTGRFTCAPRSSAVNHGPVRVRNTFHFAYADDSPFVPIGTTCYGWTHQNNALQDQTLATLKASPFNKLRMCVLPTRRNANEPAALPFETSSDGSMDLARFNPTFFQNLDKRVAQLRDLGVEADVILFHPYGSSAFPFARMDAQTDERYLRYVVARLAAYRNVWWSMANEFDLLRQKTDADWDRLFKVLQSEDPYARLRSIHQCRRAYDNSKPWITHLSAQNGAAVEELGRAPIYRQLLHKPVVFDEVRYEGHIDRRWGNLSAEEMLLRFWIGTIGGTYVTHGETLSERGQPSWLGQGGVLRGKSPARIAFLKQVLASAPSQGIDPIDQFYESHIAGKPGEYYLIYFARQRPIEWRFELYRENLAEGLTFRVDVLDTWNMTTTPIAEPFKLVRHDQYTFRAAGDRTVPLPGQPFMGLRIVRDHNAPASGPAQGAPED